MKISLHTVCGISFLFLALIGTSSARPVFKRSNIMEPSTPVARAASSGGKLDLSPWELQLPVGSPGSPQTISNSDLENGFSKQDFFFNDNESGALIMKVPGSPSSANCVTTAHSKHCRTEFREVDPKTGKPTSWDPKPTTATNRLKADLKVVKADDSGFGTVIGQIHIDDSISSKPICELFYSSKGDISIGVEQTQAGGNEKNTAIGNVPLGTRFTYEIDYSSNILKVGINGKFTTVSTFDLNGPKSYFKAGNYNQGSSPSEVHFFDITVQH